MPLPQSRVGVWIDRGLFAMSLALLAWTLLERFVPAHPVERSGATLLVAAAMAGVTGAPLLASSVARRVAVGAACVLLLVVYWSIRTG